MERIGAAVVGGGAVGCAVALELARGGMSDVFVFEKLPRVGEAQSGRNSGVVHAGVMVHLRGAADWVIARDRCDPDCVQLLGVDSPGLTSCLAIARRVRRLLLGPDSAG